jgi:bifunctional UDP-N-acetylglucosamine pyrophosphorylase/glucosamine-1-phosphate N-acetyltransferase
MGRLLDVHKAHGAAATVLTAHVPKAAGYGRMVREPGGALVKIVEEKDASAGERKIHEINTGTYVFSAAALHETLQSLSSDNAQGEYYLTDCVELLIRNGLPVASYCLEDYRVALGVNDRSQLSEAARLLRDRINHGHMERGVTMTDPATTYVDINVSIGRDTVLLPNTMIFGETVIGEDCEIGPCSELRDCTVGNSVLIRHSTANDSILEDGVTVGPFANLRPETILRSGVKIGDFVEIKKSDIGPGSKVPHLSYVGDAQIGSCVNMGAGTIVVNYDGRKKHATLIGDGAFIGCNSNLVAPLRVGEGSFIAAGSTLTKDGPAGALSLSRSPQVNKEKMAGRFIDTQRNRES